MSPLPYYNESKVALPPVSGVSIETVRSVGTLCR
jgi:hypothetical protein